MALIDNIVTPECGAFNVTNEGLTTRKLIIRKFIKNNENIYTFEDLLSVDVLGHETYEHVVDNVEIQAFVWEDIPDDIVMIVTTCKIDLCILNYIDKLVCCNECLKCDDTCEGVSWLGKYIATDTLYVILMDILTTHFGGNGMIYPYVASKYDETHTLAELMDKIESLCSCTNNC